MAVKIKVKTPVQVKKTEAMACHQTQFTPETVEQFKQFFRQYPYETFTRAE